MQKAQEWKNKIASEASTQIRKFFEEDTPAEIHEHVEWALDPQRLNYRFENGSVSTTRLLYLHLKLNYSTDTAVHLAIHHQDASACTWAIPQAIAQAQCSWLTRPSSRSPSHCHGRGKHLWVSRYLCLQTD
jgi:hypothetical protein